MPRMCAMQRGSLRRRNEAAAAPRQCRQMLNAALKPPPPPTLDPDMSVDEIMRRWPATIPVFLRHQFLCVGCPIGPFHTLAQACFAHDADEAQVAGEVIEAMGGTAKGGQAVTVRPSARSACGSPRSASTGADRSPPPSGDRR